MPDFLIEFVSHLSGDDLAKLKHWLDEPLDHAGEMLDVVEQTQTMEGDW